MDDDRKWRPRLRLLRVLAGLGPEGIAQLSWKDLASPSGTGQHAYQWLWRYGSSARFEHIFSAVLACGMPLDKPTSHIVEQCLKSLGPSRPDLVQQWQLYTSHLAQQIHSTTPTILDGSLFLHSRGTFDPYASTTDYKGSTVISDELDRRTPEMVRTRTKRW
jgi:hypothetical protein